MYNHTRLVFPGGCGCFYSVVSLHLAGRRQSAAFSQAEGGGYFYFYREGVGGCDQVVKALDGDTAEVLFGDMDRGKRRVDIGTDGHIVKTDDRYIFRDPIAEFLKRPHGSDGDQVVVGKVASGDWFISREQFPHIRIGALDGRGKPVNDRTGGGHSVFPDGFIEAVGPLFEVVDGVQGKS